MSTVDERNAAYFAKLKRIQTEHGALVAHLEEVYVRLFKRAFDDTIVGSVKKRTKKAMEADLHAANEIAKIIADATNEVPWAVYMRLAPHADDLKTLKR